jgi:hypothetical protein
MNASKTNIKEMSFEEGSSIQEISMTEDDSTSTVEEQLLNYLSRAHEGDEEGDSDFQEDEEGEEAEGEEEVECNIHEIIGKPISDAVLGECPICYEEITMINATITRCGHVMHSSCIFMSLETSPCCPMCRTQIARETEDDDEDVFEESVDEEDPDEENQEEGPNEEDPNQADDVSVEQLAAKMKGMGYTMTDVLMLFFSGEIVFSGTLKSQKREKYTTDFLNKLEEDMSEVLEGTIPLLPAEKLVARADRFLLPEDRDQRYFAVLDLETRVQASLEAER